MSRKKMTFFALLLVLCLCFTGCKKMMEEQVAEKVESSGLIAPTHVMLNALIDQDYKTFEAQMASSVNRSDLARGFVQLRDLLVDVESYSLTATKWNVNSVNGITQTSATFEMDCSDAVYLVKVSKRSTEEGIYTFWITPYQQMTKTGTLLTLRNCDALQYLFLIIGILELGFTVWMLIDALRLCKGKRGMWIAVILLAHLVINISVVSERLNININGGVFLTYTALLRYSTGGFAARICLPVGAIVYWFERRKRKHKGKEEHCGIETE